MAIPTAFFVLSWMYPLYANFVNAKKLDGHRSTALNIEKSQIGGDTKMEEAYSGDEKRMETETIVENKAELAPACTKE